MKRFCLFVMPLLFWSGIALLLVDYLLYNLSAYPPYPLIATVYSASVASMCLCIALVLAYAYAAHGKP